MQCYTAWIGNRGLIAEEEDPILCHWEDPGMVLMRKLRSSLPVNQNPILTPSVQYRLELHYTAAIFVIRQDASASLTIQK